MDVPQQVNAGCGCRNVCCQWVAMNGGAPKSSRLDAWALISYLTPVLTTPKVPAFITPQLPVLSAEPPIGSNFPARCPRFHSLAHFAGPPEQLGPFTFVVIAEVD